MSASNGAKPAPPGCRQVSLLCGAPVASPAQAGRLPVPAHAPALLLLLLLAVPALLLPVAARLLLLLAVGVLGLPAVAIAIACLAAVAAPLLGARVAPGWGGIARPPCRAFGV